MKKILSIILTVITIMLECSIPTYAAEPRTLTTDQTYTEVADSTWSFESASSSLADSTNCREIDLPSDGRITLKGSVQGSDADIRVYLYDQYGKGVMDNVSIENGTFEIYANTIGGKHYIKFWWNGGSATITYTVSFTPSQVAYDENGAIEFDKENVEYLNDCTFSSATSSEVSDINCRRIDVAKNGKITWKAYTIGNGSDIRVYVYDSYGNDIIANKSVEDGLTTFSADVSKGTYYMKLWEAFGANAKFTYTLSFKPNQSITSNVRSKTIKYSKLKKKAQSFKINAKAKTALTYEKTSGLDNIKVSSSGKVKVSKGLNKGTYVVGVRITAKETAEYNQSSKTFNLKIKVK